MRVLGQPGPCGPLVHPCPRPDRRALRRPPRVRTRCLCASCSWVSRLDAARCGSGMNRSPSLAELPSVSQPVDLFVCLLGWLVLRKLQRKRQFLTFTYCADPTGSFLPAHPGSHVLCFNPKTSLLATDPPSLSAWKTVVAGCWVLGFQVFSSLNTLARLL